MERFTNAAFSFEVTDTAAAGGDGPEGVAILLHGFPQDRRCWDRVTSALAGGGYRVLAPDLRGYSPGPGQPPGPRTGTPSWPRTCSPWPTRPERNSSTWPGTTGAPPWPGTWPAAIRGG